MIAILIGILGLLLLGALLGFGAKISTFLYHGFWHYRKACIPIALFWLIIWLPLFFAQGMRSSYFVVSLLGLFIMACFAQALFLSKQKKSQSF